jgi:hypothetical protein
MDERMCCPRKSLAKIVHASGLHYNNQFDLVRGIAQFDQILF